MQLQEGHPYYFYSLYFKINLVKTALVSPTEGIKAGARGFVSWGGRAPERVALTGTDTVLSSWACHLARGLSSRSLKYQTVKYR